MASHSKHCRSFSRHISHALSARMCDVVAAREYWKGAYGNYPCMPLTCTGPCCIAAKQAESQRVSTMWLLAHERIVHNN